MKKHLGVTLPNTMFYVCKSGQFHPNPTWGIAMGYVGMDVRKVALIWNIMMNPHYIKMDDISNVFFDTISGLSIYEVLKGTTKNTWSSWGGERD
jgi:hypothetical protein